MLSSSDDLECYCGMPASEQQSYIMLIDSQPELGRQLAAILDDTSVAVVTTTDWRRALDLAVGGKIQLMVCDIELPGNGAEELLSEIRKNHPRLLPWVLFSRSLMSRHDARFLRPLEKREILDKPFKNDQAEKILLRRLNRVRHIA